MTKPRGPAQMSVPADLKSMTRGLTRDEDTALRCLVALAESGRLTPEYAVLLAELSERARREAMRDEAMHVPAQRTAADDSAAPVTP